MQRHKERIHMKAKEPLLKSYTNSIIPHLRTWPYSNSFMLLLPQRIANLLQKNLLKPKNRPNSIVFLRLPRNWKAKVI